LHLAVTLPNVKSDAPQPLHRDGDIFLVKPYPGYEISISVIFAISSDFTEAIGATRICPGSHRMEEGQGETERLKSVAVLMEKGSCVIYTGRTVHGAGRNTLDDPVRCS
jgi:ectoine hydroxylase-related dioxygenase (phytanoyl-CoA dioxygenase family)